MTPTAYCLRRTRKANTSFYYPMRLLPPPQRAAMYALYAFCREVDDVVDEIEASSAASASAHAQLAFWRQDLDRAFRQTNPQHPVAVELGRVVETFALPTAPFFDIIAGMAMDLDRQRYADMAALTLYCQRVAVAVGQIALPIFCANQKKAGWWDPLAHHLGMAFQLTNILRDIKEDGQRGRIYLPQTALQAHGVAEETLLCAQWSPALGRVLAQLGHEAETHFHHADRLLQTEKKAHDGTLPPGLLPIQMMSHLYHRYLIDLKNRRYDSLTRPVRLSTATKLAVILQVWVQERIF